MASRTSEIEKLKRSETVELKKVREMSVNKIKEYRNQLLDNKRSQYLMVKSSEDLIKKNIQSYWERKKNYFLNLHKSLKNENEKFLLIKEKEIYDLEKNEENLIRRLEQSQNVDESTFKELEEVILTPLEQFIQKYGEDKIEKKEIRKKSNCQFITSRNLNKENDEKEICSKSLLLEDTPRLKLNLETVNSKSKNR